MKRVVILIFVLLSLILLSAGNWNNELNTSLNFSLNNYSDNWAGDETSNIIWTISINGLAEKQLTDFINTKNIVKLSLGQTMNRDKASDSWLDPLKSTDIIDIESIERLTMKWIVDPFAGLRFESQFIDMRDTAKIVYVNPCRLTESFGIARILHKDDNSELSVRFGGAIRQSFDYTAFDTLGNQYTHITNDGGLELTADYNTPICNNAILYTGKVTVYKALFNTESDKWIGMPNENNWKAVDVYFDNIFSAKITEFINVNFTIQMLYDKEIDEDIRHKENISLAINYRYL